MREFNPLSLPRPSEQSLADYQSFLKKHPLNHLDIEIGAGVGLHPILYASKNPERALVAIEHTKEKFLKFSRRAQNHTLPNLLAIHANAISWIHYALSSSQVSRYLILYPNPSPKSSDRSKRWYAMPFMGRLKETMIADGEILLVTNEIDYANEAIEWMTDIWQFKLHTNRELTAKNWPKENHRSHFEKKYLTRGETCYEMLFKKS